jgi:uncharacterized membrane protein
VNRVARTARRRWALLGLIVGIGSYAALFGWVLSQRYWAFQTFAWDLGNYNQGLYTAAFDHRLFYYTADIPSGNSGSLLALHFSPALFLLVPFYALAPNPPGLLTIQAVALGAGALPLYLLARRLELPEGWAVLLASAYLISPVLMGVGWYDFHLEALVPATVLWAIYGYYYGSRWTFVISWLLALAVIETISGLLFIFGAVGLIALGWDWLRHPRASRPRWVRTVVASGAPLLWLGIAFVLSQTLTHGTLGTLSTGYSAAYSVLGSNLTFFSVVPYALGHPGAALNALSFEAGDKLAYVLVLFGSFAFLSILGPKRLLVPAAAWVVLVILSNGSSLYEFGDQFAAYPLPFLASGAVFGLARLRGFWWASKTSAIAGETAERRRAWRRPGVTAGPAITATALVLAVCVSTGMVSPLLSDPSWNFSAISHGLPTVTSHDEALHEVLGFIPPSASVLTTPPVFPELSSRVNAYVVPISSSFQPGSTFVNSLDGYVNDSTYVLLDYETDFFSSSVIVRFANLTSFGILAENDGILLLEKGWSGPPRLWIPEQMSWAGGALGTTAYSYVDPTNSTVYGPSLSSIRPPVPRNALLWDGPYVYGLLPGKYAVTFWVSDSAQVSGPQFRMDTVSNPIDIQLVQQGSASEQHTYGFDFSTGMNSILNNTDLSNPTSGPYSTTVNITMDFSWSSLEVWSVAGWVYANSTAVRLSAVTLQQLSP